MSRAAGQTTRRSGSVARRPAVCVVGAGEDGALPGLADELGTTADLRFAANLRQLRQGLPGAEIVLIADFRSRMLERAWDAADDVAWVHVAGAGVDAALFAGLVDSDVVVTNARGVFDGAIAEYVLGLMLAFVKDLPATLDLQRRRSWRHRETRRLAGGHVLVVGAGPIGQAIGRLARAVGMTTGGVARTARDDFHLGRVVAVGDLPEVLGDADFVVLAVPLTDDTRGLIGQDEFARMSSSARLINVARGEVLDEGSLIAALDANEIAGAALDVFCSEPLAPDSPLWTHPDVIVSPHMSGDFVGWRRALTDVFVDNFRRWQQGRELHNLVDKRRGYVPTRTSGREDGRDDV